MPDPRSVVLARLGSHPITLSDVLTCERGDVLRPAIEQAAMARAIAERGLAADGADWPSQVDRLRRAIAGPEVERFLAERRADFDFAVLSHIIVADAALAELVRRQADHSDADFRLLAIRHNTDEATAESAGYLGPVVRSQLAPVLQAAVFAAAPGDVVGPVETDAGWHLVKVWSLGNSAEDSRAMLVEAVFDAWLAEQCAAAQRLPDQEVAAE